MNTKATILGGKIRNELTIVFAYHASMAELEEAGLRVPSTDFDTWCTLHGLRVRRESSITVVLVLA
jgi:hypothetical protein